MNLCNVCDSLYSLVSRQRDGPSVCIPQNYFSLKTKVSIDSLHKGFKIIYMRKGPMKKILEKMLTDYRQKGKGYKTIYFIIIALLKERIQKSIFVGHVTVSTVYLVGNGSVHLFVCLSVRTSTPSSYFDRL